MGSPPSKLDLLGFLCMDVDTHDIMSLVCAFDTQFPSLIKLHVPSSSAAFWKEFWASEDGQPISSCCELINFDVYRD